MNCFSLKKALQLLTKQAVQRVIDPRRLKSIRVTYVALVVAMFYGKRIIIDVFKMPYSNKIFVGNHQTQVGVPSASLDGCPTMRDGRTTPKENNNKFIIESGS